MKILVYPHDLNMGGSQTNAIELAAAVTALGHECIVYGRRGSLCTRIEELGLEFVESPDPGRRPSLSIARDLRALVRSRGIDIIHGYEWPPGLEAAAAAEGSVDVAAVCTVMSMAVAPFLPRSLPLVVGTQQISATEQARGRSRVHLIEPPVDLDHNGPVDDATVAQFRRKWELSDLPVVVVVSRLVPELKSEGILTAIETAGALGRTTPFQLLIVGDGKARPAMEAAAAQVNEQLGRRAVVFTGELADPRAAYAAADIMLGMGGSALRSLAFAKPLIVQGELGYFRTLTEETADEFRWQGWYGVGEASTSGLRRLESELAPLLSHAQLRAELGAFGRRLVEEFSLERAAKRQLAIYQDAFATRAQQKRQLREAVRSFSGLAGYHVGQRIARLRGNQRTDDFNAEPVASRGRSERPTATSTSSDGPILWFPGVGWDTLAGTDRHLAMEIAREQRIIWVDTPHSVLRRRDRVLPAVSHPHPNIVRLRASTIAGVQRPLLRDLANRRRASAARRYLAGEGLLPSAVIASTTAPMLDLIDDLPGRRVYYATDDYVEAASIWGVSRQYLSAARERNLHSADVVLSVTRELGRHLERGTALSRWLPNGAELGRFAGIETTEPASVGLAGPIAGVIGQFNSRTDLSYLQAVRAQGLSLLLIGPRWFTSKDDDEAFDRLIADPDVRWIDELPPDQLVPYLHAMDVGLTPYRDSVFNRRSFPLKTVEYLAAGVPVVATDVASPEGLDARWVHTAGTPAAFAALAAEVAAAPRDRAEIRRAAAEHGWDARAKELRTWLSREGE
ncbi:glycosyltransferase [Microbacterium sp. TWP3-1-2b2]|uniref:glycosyltransferase n=1 Tax=Microbacterium sp. TWP3-1-2b2 TaxID=2804651 RepID=UPI003CE73884